MRSMQYFCYDDIWKTGGGKNGVYFGNLPPTHIYEWRISFDTLIPFLQEKEKKKVGYKPKKVFDCLDVKQKNRFYFLS